METKVFLFVRKTGIDGTNVIEVDIKEAMKFLRENRKNKNGFQIGILSGKSYDDILDVYGEYAPLKKINCLKELDSIIKFDQNNIKLEDAKIFKYVKTDIAKLGFLASDILKNIESDYLYAGQRNYYPIELKKAR